MSKNLKEDLLYWWPKRVFDIVFVICFLICFSPVYAIFSFLIWKEDRHSPIYTHVRVGLHRKPFDLIKFRSMVYNADKILFSNPELYKQIRSGNNKIKDDPRVTKVGKFIRKYSIDEFPQMINVLKGEMSVVGPRALRTDEFMQYESQKPINKELMDQITTVKPGITGLWQVSGRSDVDFDTRMKMDYEYSKRKSFMYDIIIILKTPMALIKGQEGNY